MSFQQAPEINAVEALGPTDATPQPAADDARTLPEIDISPLKKAVDAAIRLLAERGGVFVRGDQLVTVVPSRLFDGAGNGGGQVIRPLFVPTLTEMLSELAHWVERQPGGEFSEPASMSCLDRISRTLLARGSWPDLPYLKLVVDTPRLRPDGSIIRRPGYDDATGIILEGNASLPEILEKPSQEDARRAAERVLEVFSDFPFASPADRAAFLAAAITAASRDAICGPTPCFFIQSNVRGSGKSLLAKAVGLCVTSEMVAVTPYLHDDNEMRKTITSIAAEGRTVVIFDNVTGEFGGPSFDAALTTTVWEGRRLSRTALIRAPLMPLWIATGVNPQMRGDCARRVVDIRLESDEARPESRGSFRYPDLLAHVRTRRLALIGDLLTILRARRVAVDCNLQLPSFGSFEAWSSQVREAVVFAGLPDPVTRQARAGVASDVVDEDQDALRLVIEGLLELSTVSMREWLRATDILKAYGSALQDGNLAKLRLAFEEGPFRANRESLGRWLKSKVKQRVRDEEGIVRFLDRRSIGGVSHYGVCESRRPAVAATPSSSEDPNSAAAQAVGPQTKPRGLNEVAQPEAPPSVSSPEPAPAASQVDANVDMPAAAPSKQGRRRRGRTRNPLTDTDPVAEAAVGELTVAAADASAEAAIAPPVAPASDDVVAAEEPAI